MILIVIAPNGSHEITEIGVGGGYYDPSKILWDESTDGVLPPRPTPDHVLSDNWQTDPTNPSVCWTVDLISYKSKKRLSINTEAGRRIVSYYGLSDGKQANMQKRGLELIRKRALGQSLTLAETTEENVLLTAGSWIDLIRTAARTAKTLVDTATSVTEVNSVTVNWPVETPPEWPT